MSEAADQVVTKGDFARLINVSPGRVSQMIAEGKIGPEALDGAGRSARIRVDVAKRQISARTDVGQRFGNGISTQLDLQIPQQSPTHDEPLQPAWDPTTEALKQERLRSLRMANARVAEQRLAEQGRYVRTEQAQAAMTKMAASIVTIIESGLADLAAAISAANGLVQRDVLHQLRTEFRVVRLKAAEAARKDLAALPRLTTDTVADAADDPLGEA